MRVEYIEERGRLASRIDVASSDGQRASYLILNEFFDVNSISEGEELSEPLLDELIYENERYRATRVALKLLGIADCSRRGLYKKLRMRRFSEKLSAEVVEYAVSLGYIREEEQIKRIILTLANRDLYGEGKILPKLESKYYDLRMCVRILSSLCESGEVDFSENAKLLIEKKLPDISDRGEIEKLLYRFGYKIREYEND